MRIIIEIDDNTNQVNVSQTDNSLMEDAVDAGGPSQELLESLEMTEDATSLFSDDLENDDEPVDEFIDAGDAPEIDLD